MFFNCLWTVYLLVHVCVQRPYRSPINQSRLWYRPTDGSAPHPQTQMPLWRRNSCDLFIQTCPHKSPTLFTRETIAILRLAYRLDFSEANVFVSCPPVELFLSETHLRPKKEQERRRKAQRQVNKQSLPLLIRCAFKTYMHTNIHVFTRSYAQAPPSPRLALPLSHKRKSLADANARPRTQGLNDPKAFVLCLSCVCLVFVLCDIWPSAADSSMLYKHHCWSLSTAWDPFLYRLVGLVVKASALKAEDPRFESRL